MEPAFNGDNELPTEGHGAEIAAIIFAVTICAVIAYAFGFGHNFQTKKTTNGLDVTNNPSIIQEISPFTTTVIQAKSAYVFDIKNQKVIFEKNANEVLPLASIAKIMTANVAIELLSPTSTIPITANALAQDGDNGLLLYEKWDFRKLLDFTLTVSSNDGAFALAQSASPNFIEKMNEKAKILGFSTMQFNNTTGLDESETKSGAYGSAVDVAKLFSYTLKKHPEVFSATRYAKFTTSSINNIKHTAVNTDAEINNIPGIIGSKTGFTDLAGGNLAIVYDAGVNYPIVVVVLGSTYDGRFKDILSLIRATNQTLSLVK